MIRRLLLVALLAQGCATTSHNYYSQRAANRIGQIQVWGQMLEDRKITKDEYNSLIETLDDRQNLEDLWMKELSHVPGP